jgi:anti-anti-sigma factor
MSLSLDSRHCGRVFVITCVGRIVTGEEITILETCMNRGLLESTRIVVQAAEVTRVDSTGMGLLVRFLSHTRNRGGDLRLASPPPFLTNLLRLTKLTTIFRIYDSEDDAIVSFLKEPALSPG